MGCGSESLERKTIFIVTNNNNNSSKNNEGAPLWNCKQIKTQIVFSHSSDHTKESGANNTNNNNANNNSNNYWCALFYLRCSETITQCNRARHYKNNNICSHGTVWYIPVYYFWFLKKRFWAFFFLCFLRKLGNYPIFEILFPILTKFIIIRPSLPKRWFIIIIKSKNIRLIFDKVAKPWFSKPFVEVRHHQCQCLPITSSINRTKSRKRKFHKILEQKLQIIIPTLNTSVRDIVDNTQLMTLVTLSGRII